MVLHLTTATNCASEQILGVVAGVNSTDICHFSYMPFQEIIGIKTCYYCNYPCIWTHKPNNPESSKIYISWLIMRYIIWIFNVCLLVFHSLFVSAWMKHFFF